MPQGASPFHPTQGPLEKPTTKKGTDLVLPNLEVAKNALPSQQHVTPLSNNSSEGKYNVTAYKPIQAHTPLNDDLGSIIMSEELNPKKTSHVKVSDCIST